MRVVVLGSGVIGVTTAYYLAEAGHEVVVARPPGRRRRWRPASPMPARSRPAIPRPGPAPGIPIKAIKWLFMRHRPLVIWPTLDPAMSRWGLMMLRNCTGRPLRAQQGPHGAAGRVQPRLPARAARRAPASPTTSAARARCSCSAPRSSSTAPPRTSRCSSSSACPTSCSTSTGCVARRAGAGAGAREVRRRPAAARRRDRRLLQVHQRAGRRLPPAGRRVPLRHADRRRS